MASITQDLKFKQAVVEYFSNSLSQRQSRVQPPQRQ